MAVRTCCYRTIHSRAAVVWRWQTAALSKDIDNLLDNNKAWVKKMNEQNPTFFKERALQQHPKCTCCFALTGLYTGGNVWGRESAA